jgi:hypothetical protein
MSNSSPILTQDGIFDREVVAARFAQASASIDPAVAALVNDVLRTYRTPGAPGPGGGSH